MGQVRSFGAVHPWLLRPPHESPTATRKNRPALYALLFLFSFTLLIVAVAGGGRRAGRFDVAQANERGGAGSKQEGRSEGVDEGQRLRRPVADPDLPGPSELASFFYAGSLDVEPERRLRNFVISPFSLSRMFRALEWGAGRETLREMRGFMDERSTLLDPPPLEEPAVLKLAERLYVRSVREDKQLEAYKAQQRELGTDVKVADFESAREAAREINAFVSHETGGYIGRLLGVFDLPAIPDIALLNAAVLKAPWTEPFGQTFKGFFRSPTGGEQRVEFMGMVAGATELQFLETPAFKGVRLGLSDSKLGMYIVVPRYFTEVVDRLSEDPALIDEVIEQMIIQHVADIRDDAVRPNVLVQVPRFLIPSEQCTLNVLPILARFGMTHVRPGEADFTRMSRLGAAMGVDMWRHAAGIEADKQGVLASGASASALGFGSAPEEPEYTFTADQAFFFQIRYQPHFARGPQGHYGEEDLTLFAGHIVDALAAQEG